MLALATLVRDGVEAAGAPLSPSARAVLLTLRHWQPVTVSELAGILDVRQPTMTSVVNGLVADGLVDRGTKQGRTAPLTLTPQGEAEAQRLQDAQRHAVATLLGPLDLAERAALVIRRLRRFFEKDREEVGLHDLTEVVDLAVGANHNCAVLASGRLASKL